MEKGTYYVIDMTGTFDTFIRLQDAGGTEVAFDDDGGQGLNARLLYVPAKSGNVQNCC